MTLLSPPRAPLLAAALEAAARRDPTTGDALAHALAADEEVLVPTSADGRHPLGTGDDPDAQHLTAFSGPGLALWGHPWRPPLDIRSLTEVLGWVVSTGRTLHLDHLSEGDGRIGPRGAAALLGGQRLTADDVAAGDPYRNPGPVSPVPASPLPPPGPTSADSEGQVTYGRRWDPSARRVVDEVLAEELASVPDLVGGYVASRQRGADTEALTFLDQEVRVTRYAHGEVHQWWWARFAEGLFLTETSVAVDDGSARPPPHLVVLTRPDGLIRTWVARADGTSDTTTASSPDMVDRWVGAPAFGVHSPLLDVGA